MRIPSEQWNTAEKMKGTEKREKDRCRALESGTRSGKWRRMDEADGDQ